MNNNLKKLQPYPFENLRTLLSKATKDNQLSAINLSIGEPKNPTPEFIKQALSSKLETLANYPKTKGEDF